MNGVFIQLAALCTAAGLLAGAAVVVATRQGLAGLHVAVEFWVAAGLLRLAGDLSWPVVGAAAGILALRQLLNLGLRLSPLARRRTVWDRSSVSEHG